jgi:hypothetical protein
MHAFTRCGARQPSVFPIFCMRHEELRHGGDRTKIILISLQCGLAVSPCWPVKAR